MLYHFAIGMPIGFCFIAAITYYEIARQSKCEKVSRSVAVFFLAWALLGLICTAFLILIACGSITPDQSSIRLWRWTSATCLLSSAETVAPTHCGTMNWQGWRAVVRSGGAVSVF